MKSHAVMRLSLKKHEAANYSSASKLSIVCTPTYTYIHTCAHILHVPYHGVLHTVHV